MAIVFQLGSGPQVRRSASRASSPSRTRSQTRPAYAAPVPADHGADVTGGERELSHQSHEHRRPHRPRERVAKGAGGEGPHTGGGAGRGWRRAAHGWWSGARAVERPAGDGPDRLGTRGQVSDCLENHRQHGGDIADVVPEQDQVRDPAGRAHVGGGRLDKGQLGRRHGDLCPDDPGPHRDLGLGLHLAQRGKGAARGGEGAGIGVVGRGAQGGGVGPGRAVHRGLPPPGPDLLGGERQDRREKTQDRVEGQRQGGPGRRRHVCRERLAAVRPVLDQLEVVVAERPEERLGGFERAGVVVDVVDTATQALDVYGHTRAPEATETFFWTFCDDYLELVKDRAYGSESIPADATASARAALVLALDTILRLLAPVLPFATEEVWSWWREGSVHRAPWPDAAPLRAAADNADPGTLAAAGRTLAALRKVKSEAKVSMRTGIVRAEVAVPAAELALVQAAASDVRAAGRVADLVLIGDHVRDVPAVLSAVSYTHL